MGRLKGYGIKGYGSYSRYEAGDTALNKRGVRRKKKTPLAYWWTKGRITGEEEATSSLGNKEEEDTLETGGYWILLISLCILLYSSVVKSWESVL